MATPERRFELTTTLALAPLSKDAVEEYARALEDAIRRTIASMPAVTAYFVQSLAAAREIEVGLRFELVDVSGLEAWAADILDDAIALANREEHAEMRPELESSVLVPA